MPDYSQQVPAVARALVLLDAVAAAPEGLVSGALEGVVEGSRSSLFALLNTLRNHGWLVQDDAGRYTLGPAVRRLVPPVVHDDAAMRDALAAAATTAPLDEAVALVRPDGDGRRIIAHRASERLVRCSYAVGERRTAETADALVLRADLDGDLATVRESGLAEAATDGAVELAAPVCRDGHRPDAAVLVGIPAQRATPERLSRLRHEVRALAADTSRRLGAPTWQPWGANVSEVAPSRPLDDDEIATLLDGGRSAQLACLRDDGSPHVVPLWFEYDGRDILLAASPGASWAAYVGQGARVSLTVEEPWPALRRVFVSGWAAPVDETTVAGGVVGLRRRLATRHLGRGAADLDAFRSAEGWSVVRLHPDRVHGRAGLGAPPDAPAAVPA